jgi:hypothetical protein
MTTRRSLAAIITVAWALLTTIWLARNERTPTWARPAIAIVLATAVILLVAVTGGWRQRAVWLSVAIVALVLVASGLTRSRSQHYVGEGAGETVARLDVWWPLLALAVAVVVVALVVARARLAVVPLATLALGLIIVTLLARDVVTGQWISGRPVRRRGRVLRRAPAAIDAWANAAVEEADAVVAFTELGWRLERVGAPAALVHRCRRAATDEERHARVCWALSERQAEAVPWSEAVARLPRPRWQRIEVMRLAIESYADGVVNEGGAASELEQAADTSTAPVAMSLRRMARDEQRHAALAADIVTWCRAESGPILNAALRAVAHRLPVPPSPIGLVLTGADSATSDQTPVQWGGVKRSANR